MDETKGDLRNVRSLLLWTGLASLYTSSYLGDCLARNKEASSSLETSSSLLTIFGSGGGLRSYKELLPLYLHSYLKEVVILGLTLWKVV